MSLLYVKYMLSGHSTLQEINHLWKFTSGFIGPQILNFERSLGLSLGPQSSLVPLCKISFGGPAFGNIMTSKLMWGSAWQVRRVDMWLSPFRLVGICFETLTLVMSIAVRIYARGVIDLCSFVTTPPIPFHREQWILPRVCGLVIGKNHSVYKPYISKHEIRKIFGANCHVVFWLNLGLIQNWSTHM